MEYVRASHALGINTPSQCGISNSFLIHRSVTRVNVYFSHSFMMRWRMLFRQIVPQILVSLAPINMKLPLFDPVFDPIEAFIHGPCAFLFYCSTVVSCGCGVVSL
jgi:hypothetical protein